jgi:hypothetical protein
MNANDILTGPEHQDSMNTGGQEQGVPKFGQILKLLARILAALVLFAMFLFCTFGFLASFEPGNGMLWKVGYGALACGFLLGAVALVRSGIANRGTTRGLG